MTVLSSKTSSSPIRRWMSGPVIVPRTSHVSHGVSHGVAKCQHHERCVAAAASRRQLLTTTLGSAMLMAADGAQALPLAPLGKVERIGGDKLTNLSTEEIKDMLARDLSEGQYFVTGNLTREIFADDCRFVDPTNDVTGLSKYVTALGILFDPQSSFVKLKSIKVSGPSTIEADYESGGYLKFPWKPRVAPYEGHIVYTLNSQGLVQTQQQTWSISPAQALLESFTPTAGPPSS